MRWPLDVWMGRLVFVVAFAMLVEHVEAYEGAARLAIPHKVIAIGDVHGDVVQLRTILELAAVIDPQGDWIAAPNTHVVQLGDLLDRGPEDYGVLQFMMNLQPKARARGGDVVGLMGNHELMNLAFRFHYVHPESDAAFGKEGRRSRVDALRAASPIGAFLRSLPLVHRINATVFVHAGLTPEFAALGVEEINRRREKALERYDFFLGQEEGLPPDRAREIRDAAVKALDRESVFSIDGPIWTRSQIHEASNRHCDSVHTALQRLHASRLVVGHTVQRSGRVESYCDDALLAIDVGMSRWMYGSLAALEISDDTPSCNTKERDCVMLQEIRPSTLDSSTDGEESAETSPHEELSLESALRSDEHLLQEIYEVLQEKTSNRRALKPLE